MNFTIKLACTVLAFLFSTSSLAKVKFEVIDRKEKIASITIVEKIEHEEDLDFIFFYNRLVDDGYKLKLNAIVLNSQGGNSFAAMKIGEFVREKKLNTYVSSNANCASACVYVLIGGVVRMAYGRVAVHRTTFTNEYPIEKLEKALRDADKKTVAYVEAMGISTLLADAILNTPNWATRQIDDRERRRWGVHGTDRIYEEMWFRKTAIEAKLTLDEVLNVFDNNISACKTPPINFEMTMWDCVRSKIKKSR
jgi:hypothetical protein